MDHHGLLNQIEESIPYRNQLLRIMCYACLMSARLHHGASLSQSALEIMHNWYSAGQSLVRRPSIRLSVGTENGQNRCHQCRRRDVVRRRALLLLVLLCMYLVCLLFWMNAIHREKIVIGEDVHPSICLSKQRMAETAATNAAIGM